jgi:hypothetical protein
MVVTAVALECDSYVPNLLAALGPDRYRIRDSKDLFTGGPIFRRGELVTLAWCRALGWTGQSYLALRRFLSAPSEIDAVCDPGRPRLCEGEQDVHLPLWSSKQESIDAGAAIASDVARAGMRVITARSRFLCVRKLRQLAAEFGSKVQVDARMLVDLVREIHDVAGDEVTAFCGRSGGLADYKHAVAATLGKRGRIDEVARGSQTSSYVVQGFGQLHFVKGLESLHATAALASMIGKYLREISMRLICEQVLPGHHESGYPGPRTVSFVRRSAERRHDLGLPDECFLRRDIFPA